RDGPSVVHGDVVNVVVLGARSHARRGIDGIGEVPALQGGVQPAVRVAQRKRVFVSEVLVYSDGVGVGACDVWICGQEVRGDKRIIVIRGKSSQGFQYACGLVQWPRDLIVGARLPLEGDRVRCLRVVNDDWRVAR